MRDSAMKLERNTGEIINSGRMLTQIEQVLKHDLFELTLFS